MATEAQRHSEAGTQKKQRKEGGRRLINRGYADVLVAAPPLCVSVAKNNMSGNECNFSGPSRQFLARGIDSGYNPVGR